MKAYKLKITIKTTKPPIWRRCIVPAGITFSQLTVILHKVIGWSGYHLSEYVFTNLKVRFREEVSDADNFIFREKVLDSSKYIIDYYLDQVKNFSYIYDFGDYWNHEVKIEEVLDDYEYDYPTVLKYKLDTPPEDCGGVLGYYEMLEDISDAKTPEQLETKEWFEDSFVSYDLDKVNAMLRMMVVTDKKVKPISERELQERSLRGKCKLDKVKGLDPKKSDKSTMGKTDYSSLKKLGKAFAELLKYSESFQGEQDDEESSYELDLEKYKSVEVVTSGNLMQDFMLNLNEKDVNNYIKYLQLTVTDYSTKLSKIKKILSFLSENPEYYLYVLYKNSLEVLFDIFDNNVSDLGFGKYISDSVYDAIQNSAMLGFFKVQDKGSKCVIQLAKDAGEIVAKLKQVDSESVYSNLKLVDKYLGAIVRNYGLIGIDEAIDIIKENNPSLKMDAKELKRMFYWHVRMKDMAQTGYNKLTQETFIFAPGYPAAEIMVYRQDHNIDKKIGYKQLDFSNPDTFTSTLGNMYYCWEEMAEMLHEQVALDEYEIEGYINRIFDDVVRGCTASQIYEDLKNNYPEKNPFGLYMYWHSSFACAAEMGLPYLKGYSRYEYYKETGSLPENLPMSDKALPQYNVGRNSELTMLPEEDQWKLFYIQGNDNLQHHKDKCIDIAKELLDKYGDDIYVLASLPEALMALEQRDMAKEVLRKMILMDHSLKKQINAMLKIINSGMKLAYFEDGPFDYDPFDDFDYTPQDPVIREHPKIGSNDPCPCGSGKKFKKCCKGKGIYD